MHKKGVIFAIAITIAALLLCCGIRLYRDRDERILVRLCNGQTTEIDAESCSLIVQLACTAEI